ncbi:hypothetical protein BKA93DRAFT_753948 [Sparassis latifolia]|uniref:Methyltransferase type 11 domain-containing protein n=1 Tax=Sparassis crispa TaxID=139825 RepID=A0A401G690_9APHY|nr:hypothetical protein SCP_0105590 [Sparassis crispa]GBE77678.1 hypothetical protein SCP_0105590 [Sparassis crispa]
MPVPDYELQSYWENRFRTESHFEWLGDGVATIIPHLRASLRAQRVSSPPRLLHIGAGSSWLSDCILETYRDEFGQSVDASMIVNLDFSEEVVRRGMDSQAGGGGGMRWIRADALQWQDLAAVLVRPDSDKGGLDHPGLEAVIGSFGLVVDKSTSDSIACAENVALSSSDPHLNPIVKAFLEKNAAYALKLYPVEVLALHLASLTHPGAIWIALSFSASRFEFLASPERVDTSLNTISSVEPSRYWVLQQVDEVEACPGKEGVGAPHVQHFVYVLRRTDYTVL